MKNKPDKKWIDVETRQPQPGCDVLVCDDEGLVYIEPVEDGWLESWEYRNYSKIIAWMPLPIPQIPKDEQ